MQSVRLRFVNRDANPMGHEIVCRPQDVPVIMGWYRGYHAGDRYTVAVDGMGVALDVNGLPRDGLPHPVDLMGAQHDHPPNSAINPRAVMPMRARKREAGE